ncbi:MAG: addiction module protein [Deinococcota bacterium]|nr:addiction module protein [Deinococcota bacterium]
MSFEEVKTLVLNLNLRERAALAQALLQTIEQPAKEEIAALWLEEAERRLDLVERGKMRIISGEEARQRVRKAVP